MFARAPTFFVGACIFGLRIICVAQLLPELRIFDFLSTIVSKVCKKIKENNTCFAKIFNVCLQRMPSLLL